MMVDSGATTRRHMVDLPEKDDDGGYASGGWKSEDGRLSCGYSSFRGKRASMEDFYDIKTSKIDGKAVCLFGIFDGHGGSRAAKFLKEHLFENLMKHSEFIKNTKMAITETYKKTDMDFLESEKHSFRDDGSTASTAVLVGNHLFVGNVGDSRTIISKAGKAIPLSDDHKPNRSDERKRIENAGGVVMWAGTWRVGGVLAMSRAFGNRMLKQFVVAEPEIQEQEVDKDLELLVLASDGLWDVVPNEDAVSIAQTEEEPEAAARKLTETAFHQGSADNITCIVVKFHHEKTESEEMQPNPNPDPKAEPTAEAPQNSESESKQDTKEEPEETTQEVSSQTAQSGSNGVHNFGNKTTRVPKAAAQSQPNGNFNVGSKKTSVPKAESDGTNKATKRKPTPPPQRPDAFWTICNRCKFHYEFVRMYVNGTLLCDTCKKPFIAKETAPPPGYSSSKVPCQQKHLSGDNAPNQNTHVPDAKKSGPDPNAHDSEKNAPAAKKTRQELNPNPHDSGKNVAAAKRSGTGSNQNAYEKNVQSAKSSGPGPNQNAHDPGKNVPSAKSSRPKPNQNAHDPGKNVQAANKSGTGQAGSESVRNANQEKVPHSGTANVGSRDHPIGAKAATVVQEALNKLKREHADDNTPVGLQEHIKKSKLDDNSRNKMNCNMGNTSGGFPHLASGTEEAGGSAVAAANEVRPRRVRESIIDCEEGDATWITFCANKVPSDQEKFSAMSRTDVTAKMVNHRMKALQCDINLQMRDGELFNAMKKKDELVEELKKAVKDQQLEVRGAREAAAEALAEKKASEAEIEQLGQTFRQTERSLRTQLEVERKGRASDKRKFEESFQKTQLEIQRSGPVLRKEGDDV